LHGRCIHIGRGCCNVSDLLRLDIVRFVVKARSHKYIRRYKLRSGKWAYVYPKEKKGREPVIEKPVEKPYQATVLEGNPQNRQGGGFYINIENEAVMVPQKYIHGTFYHMGFTWVVHNRIGRDQIDRHLVVSELRSGLRGYSEATGDYEEIVEGFRNRMKEIGSNRIKEVVKKATSITERELSDLDANKVPLEPEPMSEDEKDKLMGRIALQYVDGRVDLVKKWVYQNLPKDEDWLTLQAECEKHNPEVVKKAIERNMWLEEAVGYVRNLSWIAHDVLNIDEDRVEAWADRKDIDLVDFEVTEWAYEDKWGNYEEAEEVIITLENNWDLEEAREYYLEIYQEDSRSVMADERRHYQDKPIEDRQLALEFNAFTSEIGLGGGVNETSKVTLENGIEIEGVWKPSRGEKGLLRPEIRAGTYFAREALAYEIDKALGLGLVPPTVIREYDNDLGSVQEFAGDAVLPGELNGWNKKVPRDQIVKGAVLDFLMKNTDRHAYNFMIDSNDDLILIDNGLCFPDSELAELSSKLFDEVPGEDLPEGIQEKLESVDWNKIFDKYREHGITESEIQGFLQRLSWLDSEGKLPTYGQLHAREWSNE
jgi:hypothetical protein